MAWPEKNLPTTDASEKRTLGAGVFRRCDGCAETLTAGELAAAFEVCPLCSHHHKLDAEGWRRLLLDEGELDPWDAHLEPGDPLRFRDDGRSYRDRIAVSQKKTRVREAVEIGRGRLAGRPIAYGAFVFAFMGGSMGSVAGEKVTRLFERATSEQLPVVLLQASGGARMQEGILSLMQMAKSVSALERFRRVRLPFLSVLLHPTTGGVAASFAFLGDVNIAEPKALIGFAGPRVIENTIRQTLPPGFQRSEFLIDHGMIDLIVARTEMKAKLASLLNHLTSSRKPPLDGAAAESPGAAGSSVGGPLPDPKVKPTTSLVEKLWALQQKARRGMLLGLDRVKGELASLGDPHEGLTAVHIAGSNGKGSTAAMVESIARAAGLRTGLYTSPHLCRFAERIRIDGEPIDDVSFDRALDAVLTRCRDDLTFFESLTLAAFYAFREARVDLAVLEVGLGGRLDATNVIEAPLSTAITSISLEHTAILGDTLDAIAREKAGILKRGAPVVLGPLEPEADGAIAEVAASVGAGPIQRVRRAGAWAPGVLVARWDDGTSVIQGPGEGDRVKVELALRGPHQAENAAVATAVAHHLLARWPALDLGAAIPKGLAETRWPGRLESLSRGGIEVLLDCAHNPEGIARLREALLARCDPARTALVFGALADKRWPQMLAALAPLAARRYYTEPKGRAPAPLEELARVAPGEAIAEPSGAITRALAESTLGDTVIVTGSIYLVGEIRAALLGIEADPVIAL